jgi:hypothetical protein
VIQSAADTGAAQSPIGIDAGILVSWSIGFVGRNTTSTPRRNWRLGWTGCLKATMTDPFRWTKRKPLVAWDAEASSDFGGMFWPGYSDFSRLSMAGMWSGQGEGIF